MHGPPHKAIRKSFLALFTRKALGTYVELQDALVRRHIAQWLHSDACEREIRPFIRCVLRRASSGVTQLLVQLKKTACETCCGCMTAEVQWQYHMCRDLNAATSQEVFAGPYLDDPVEKEKFSAAFMDMTQGFLAFPLCIPGTAVWKGKQGRLYIISVLNKAAARSKIAMQA